jgi:hypothetical protein
MIRREAFYLAILLATAMPFTAQAQRKGGGRSTTGNATIQTPGHSTTFQHSTHQQMMQMQQKIAKEQQQQGLQHMQNMMPEVKQLSQEIQRLKLSGKQLERHARRYGWYIVGPGYWWTRWPNTKDPIYKPLNTLKTKLDQIASTRQPTDPENLGLRSALYAVHDPETLYPSEADVAKLASNITTALTKRGEGSNVDTRTLAAHLQGTMNSLQLSIPEFQTSLVQQKVLLDEAKVQEKHSNAVLNVDQQIATDVLRRIY